MGKVFHRNELGAVLPFSTVTILAGWVELKCHVYLACFVRIA
jgi:hypothetical protein